MTDETPPVQVPDWMALRAAFWAWMETLPEHYNAGMQRAFEAGAEWGRADERAAAEAAMADAGKKLSYASQERDEVEALWQESQAREVEQVNAAASWRVRAEAAEASLESLRAAAGLVVEYARTVEGWLDEAGTFPREWVTRHALRNDLRAAIAAFDALAPAVMADGEEADSP